MSSGETIKAEGHRLGRLNRILVVVLHGEDVDFFNRLAAVEFDLQPIGEDTVGTVSPAATAGPVQALAVPVVRRAGRLTR